MDLFCIVTKAPGVRYESDPMKCPQCGHLQHRVLETRDRAEEIRRRRECLQCKLRFSTVESLLVHYPHVIKKDGGREPFSKEKLRRGIQIACRKRPVSVGQIEAIVNRISRWVQSTPDKELAAHRIGQAVIQELKTLDDVAYVRFASVYKSFQDVTEFMKCLEIAENLSSEKSEPAEATRAAIESFEREDNEGSGDPEVQV